ncbi:S8 family peptidase [Nonomuraea sp. LPB2021202275-12-8]|uniref:S8 family peptidase n=1 Tax=Nonomuraea sp. LPB2021202275-12-8 TaxID=3120159 RepID=UPI00300C98D4
MRSRSLTAGGLALATATALLAGAPATARAGAPDTGDPAISPTLAAEIDARQKVRSIVELRPGHSVSAVAGDIEKASTTASVLEATESPNFLVAEIDSTTLAELRKDPRVKAVYQDTLSVAFLDDSTGVIASDDANASGWTGRGTTVAVLDTGIDRDHPFLSGRIVDEACFSTSDATSGAVSLCPNGQSSQTGPGAADAEIAPCMVSGGNQCSHGTHVAGIAAGRTVAGSPGNGVAPAAGILPIQVFSRIDSLLTCGGAAPCFMSFTSDQKLALEYVARTARTHNVAAVNMSYGGGGPHREHCDGDPQAGALKDQFDGLLNAGVAPVAAAGNAGWRDAVASPACVSSAVAVGATNDRDQITAFSNRGKLLDLFAPGAEINSSVPDDTYGVLNGTSMSTPHVAGSFALMKQAYPHLNPVQILQRLQASGDRVVSNPFGPRVSTVRVDVGAATGSVPRV